VEHRLGLPLHSCTHGRPGIPDLRGSGGWKRQRRGCCQSDCRLRSIRHDRDDFGQPAGSGTGPGGLHLGREGDRSRVGPVVPTQESRPCTVSRWVLVVSMLQVSDLAATASQTRNELFASTGISACPAEFTSVQNHTEAEAQRPGKRFHANWSC
jgi:hypothetical protein